MNENLVNAAIPAATMKEVTDALDAIATKLNPFLMDSLTKETLDTMQKLGERSESFTKKAIEVALVETSFVPAYLNATEAKEDLELYLQLKTISARMKAISNLVDTNGMLAGAEALDFANDFYRNIRFLSKNHNASARAHFEDLNDRYARPSKRKKDNPSA